MYPRFRKCIQKNITTLGPSAFCGARSISSSEISTALRPFYFVVHPDLFGRHPKQRSVNEESLKQLSAHIEALHQRRLVQIAPKSLPFYIRDSDSQRRDTFKLINIILERNGDPKKIIKTILESCNLSTEYVDKIKATPNYSNGSNMSKFYDANQSSYARPFRDVDYNNSEFSDFEFQFRKTKESDKKTLRRFLDKNLETARERNKELEDLQEEVSKLQQQLVQRLELKDIHYDCGWYFEHYRGCLKTLERLANLHEKELLKALRGRTVVFAAFTGVSLEGHVMLFTGDVLNSWMDFIKNIPKHDAFLAKIPAYEYALSQVLRSIKIGKRKFMPKAQASSYASHLRKVTTALLDFLSTQKYPESWPKNLSDFEIVIESESGPLMVSPTGQLIAPATCPGSILVDFLTNNLDEAREKAVQYNRNKHIERELHKQCIEELKLKTLSKDDSVTPEKMIKTLEKLITSKLSNLTNVHLNITNYYSVLSDGTICIPWDYTLE